MYFQKSSLLKMVPPANEHLEAGHFVSEVRKVTRLHLLHTSGTNLMRKIVEGSDGLRVSQGTIIVPSGLGQKKKNLPIEKR